MGCVSMQKWWCGRCEQFFSIYNIDYFGIKWDMINEKFGFSTSDTKSSKFNQKSIIA